MDKVVVQDYYHVTTMDENVNWMKLAHLLSIFIINPRGSFRTSTFASTFSVAFSNVHIVLRKIMHVLYVY